MRIVWVTGPAGAGKSSVCAHLSRHGWLAIDADDGYCEWVNTRTGKLVERPADPPPGWLAKHDWILDPVRVAELAQQREAGPAFLFGSVANDAALGEHFATIVCLVANDETLRVRLKTRTGNDFGKHPEELAAVLAANRSHAARYRAAGATLVDAGAPLDEVASAVLAAAGAN